MLVVHQQCIKMRFMYQCVNKEEQLSKIENMQYLRAFEETGVSSQLHAMAGNSVLFSVPVVIVFLVGAGECPSLCT